MQEVRVERRDDLAGGTVAEVVLDRPGVMNALSTRLAAELRDRLRELSGEAGLRVVVLRSSRPRAFCAGADLRERDGMTDDALRAQRVVFRELAQTLRGMPMPVVAAVEGYALGGGFELALLCDLIVADPTAVLALPEVSVGVVPGLGGTQLLSRRVGVARASDVILTARRLGAQEAFALGAIDRLADEGAAIRTALDLAVAIAANSPVGVRNAKRAIRLGHETDLAAGLEIEDAAWRATAFSADRVEGVRAFVEKRPPVWPGTPDNFTSLLHALRHPYLTPYACHPSMIAAWSTF